MKLWKRYQHFVKNGEGIAWSQWFEVSPDITREKWQLPNKLRNEYKESEEMPKD